MYCKVGHYLKVYSVDLFWQRGRCNWSGVPGQPGGLCCSCPCYSSCGRHLRNTETGWLRYCIPGGRRHAGHLRRRWHRHDTCVRIRIRYIKSDLLITKHKKDIGCEFIRSVMQKYIFLQLLQDKQPQQRIPEATIKQRPLLNRQLTPPHILRERRRNLRHKQL